MDVEVAEPMPAGRELWQRWQKAIGSVDDQWLNSSAGENLGFHRIIARKINHK